MESDAPYKMSEISEEQKNFRKKFRFTIEPLGFLYLTGLVVQTIATPNLFLYKVCRVDFNQSEALCSPSNQTAHNAHRSNRSGLINEVQAYVTQLEIYMQLINNIPSIFVILFLLPWSDKHGRKPLLIIPIIGHMLSTLLHMLNYYEEFWPGEYLLIANIPIGLLGGQISFHVTTTRYMIDVTNEENRTWRLALLAGVMGISMPIAHLASSYIYEYGGSWAAWGTSLILMCFALLYVTFFVEETVNRYPKLNKIDPKEMADPIKKAPEKTMMNVADDQLRSAGKENNCKEFVNVLNNAWYCFVVTFKRREGYKRACICFLLATILLGYFIREPRGILYLFTRKMFSWDAPEYARYTTINSTVSVLGTLFILPVLSRYLKWKDGTIGMISLVGNTASCFLIAFAVTPAMMYISCAGHLLAAGIHVTTTSLLSKVVGDKDLSHVYSVSACVQSIEPLIAAPTFNLMYKATLATFPGCVFLVEACFLIVVFGCFVSVLILQRKDEKQASRASQQTLAW